MQSRVSVPPWSSPRAVEHLSSKQIGFLLGSLLVCVACRQIYWAVLSDEQMSNGWSFSLLNDEQMSNKVRVEHQPV